MKLKLKKDESVQKFNSPVQEKKQEEKKRNNSNPNLIYDLEIERRMKKLKDNNLLEMQRRQTQKNN